jgi:hypothetical protein
MQSNRLALEGALARGHLWVAMRHGKYWQLRRNGEIKLWKTKPEWFSIPVKAGLKSCTRITHESKFACITDHNWQWADFVISETKPEPQ